MKRVIQEVDEIGIDEARKIGREMGPILTKHAIACSAPITIEVHKDFGGEVWNGSCGFIRTPERDFVVTANHVVEAALVAINEQRARVLIGQCWIENFEECVIASSKALDIATLRFSERALPYVKTKPGWESRFSTYWPPIAPGEHCNVFFNGYPGAIRDVDEKGFTYRTYTGLCVTSTVTDSWIRIVRDPTFEDSSDTPNLAPLNFNTGGISGAPLFSCIKVNGLIQLIFCGVITEGNAAFDLIHAARADSINADGTLSC